MNGQAPVAAQAEMETKRFTEAENKKLAEKMQKYQEAANVVNEWLTFLKEQYGIGDNEGWQLGEGCFARPAQRRDPTGREATDAAKGDGFDKPTVNRRVRQKKGEMPLSAVNHKEHDVAPAAVSQNGM